MCAGLSGLLSHLFPHKTKNTRTHMHHIAHLHAHVPWASVAFMGKCAQEEDGEVDPEKKRHMALELAIRTVVSPDKICNFFSAPPRTPHMHRSCDGMASGDLQHLQSIVQSLADTRPDWSKWQVDGRN